MVAGGGGDPSDREREATQEEQGELGEHGGIAEKKAGVTNESTFCSSSSGRGGSSGREKASGNGALEEKARTKSTAVTGLGTETLSASTAVVACSTGSVSSPNPNEPESEVNPQIELPKSDLCPICLEPIRYRSVIKGCFHAFCAPCIKTWAGYHVEACRRANRAGNQEIPEDPRCPLCKTSFHKLFYSITKAGSYKILDLSLHKESKLPKPQPMPGVTPSIVPYRLSLAGQEIIREMRRQRRRAAIMTPDHFLLNWNRESTTNGDEDSPLTVVVSASIARQISPGIQRTQQPEVLSRGPQRDTKSVREALELEKRKRLYRQIRNLAKTRKRSQTANNSIQLRDFDFRLPPSLRGLGGGPPVTLWVRREMEAVLAKPPARSSVGKLLEVIRNYEYGGWVRSNCARDTSNAELFRQVSSVFERELGITVGNYIIKAFLGELEAELRRQRKSEGEADRKWSQELPPKYEKYKQRGAPISFSINGKREWSRTKHKRRPTLGFLTNDILKSQLRCHASHSRNPVKQGKKERTTLSWNKDSRKRERWGKVGSTNNACTKRRRQERSHLKNDSGLKEPQYPDRSNELVERRMHELKTKLLRRFRERQLGRYRNIQFYKSFGLG